jgi:hypothetical protein
MEPGVARVAVAVNMYQTAVWRNLKTLVDEISYQTAQAKEQPAAGSKPEFQTKRERKLVNDERSSNCLD